MKTGVRHAVAPIAVAILLFSADSHAAEDEPGCVNGLYAAAGQYARCEGKAKSKIADLDQALLKCRQKYAKAWPKLGAQFPGTTCDGERFVETASTVIDKLTRLEWEKKDSADGDGNPSNPHDADNTYSWGVFGTCFEAPCGTLFFGFLDALNTYPIGDWRLPSLDELLTIAATDGVPCASGPCVATPLLATTHAATGTDAYFTSSPVLSDADDPYYTWSVLFAGGTVATLEKFAPGYARGVRGGL
jgi:hypothetical protein